MRFDQSSLLPPADRGWVFFDASCGLCVASASSWWGALFARHGFVWLPLQTPGLADLLGMDEEELRREIKLRRADGRIFGGVGAYSVMLRAVWWLWPAGVLLLAPGIKPLAAWVYRWIARRRHRLGSSCRLPG